MRLLPRLVAALRDTPASPHFTHIPRRNTRVSPPKRYPRNPPTFSHNGRTRSILLSKSDWVTRANDWTRHVKTGKKKARELSDQEAEWESSPYLRMLASPLRKCVLTNRLFPSHFMIRLSSTQKPIDEQPDAEKTGATGRRSKSRKTSSMLIVPDGVQHPRYAPKRNGFGLYGICNSQVFEHVGTTRPDFGHMYPQLRAHVHHLLRIRVLQELNVLAGTLERIPGMPMATILRRLTREELAQVRELDILPKSLADEGAVALIIAPPANRDPHTGLRPIADIGAAAPSDPRETTGRAFPASTLLQIDDHEVSPDLGCSHSHPVHRIPLYNAFTIFPSPSHRVALHTGLARILAIESRFRKRAMTETKTGGEVADRRASHAFLLCSSKHTVKRGADPVPLAIALWRLRMWEMDLYGSVSLEDSWAAVV